LAVYGQTANHGFIHFDDSVYVTDNPHVKGGITGANIAWAFTATSASNWHPLTWLSHMTDVQLFDLNPRGHHLTSVVMHAASALLISLLLARITAAPWQSLFVAALFALHPLHVESVAWVAERKDVLSCLFWMLTLILYAGYARQRGAGRYMATLACFSIGLMAKPMLVTLPVVLLLLDYWPLERFRPGQDQDGTSAATSVAKLAWEKIPFFLLSALSAAITIHAQHQGGAMKNLDAVPLMLRIGNAMVSYIQYLLKAIWPHDLALLYPIPASIPPWQILGSALLLLAISTATIRCRRSHPYLMVGWLWYLVTLLPVIGLIQVGGQSMADRYTYIPLTGIFIIAAWGANDLLDGWRQRRPVLSILAIAIICALTAATWHQLGYWRDSITLYRHTLAVTRDNYLILNNLGIAMDEQGNHQAAVELYEEALRAWPRSANAHINLGAVYAHEGKFEEAIGHYREALRIQPDYTLAMVDMGKALTSIGRPDEAITQFEQALKLDNGLADAHLNLALLLRKAGRVDEASRHYETVLKLEPYSVKAPNNMGIALAQEGKLAEAAGYFADAVRIDPASVEAHFNLGVALARMNRRDEAIRQFEQVLRLKPDSAAGRGWLEKLGR
jgi:tetratricopeptide (TPR) repeat protein